MKIKIRRCSICKKNLQEDDELVETAHAFCWNAMMEDDEGETNDD